MADLIDTTEMYLKTILELEEDGVTPLRARIVDRLGHSGPTVSQTVARMERDGLLHVMGDRRLELTERARPRDGGAAQASTRRASPPGRHWHGVGAGSRRGLPLGARHERRR